MLKNPSIVLVAVSLALGAGCGWKADGAERLEELYPTPPAPPPDPCPMPDDAQGAAPSDFGSCAGLTGGRWAARFVQFGSMSPMGEPWNLILADLFVATPSSDGKSFEMTFCNQATELSNANGPISMGKTQLPAATRAAIGAAKLVLPLPGDGTFSVADVAWLWGVKDLANPLTDAIPTSAADPRVWDQDADGKPGVTIEVTNPTGQRYMARRSRWTLQTGTPSADGHWLTGKIDFAITENALGASNTLLTTVAPISVRSECVSVYQLRCVPEAFTCADLVNGWKTLFRDAPK